MSTDKVTYFDVMNEMCTRNLDIKLAPIGSNVLSMKTTNKGRDTRLEIGIGGNIISKVLNGEVVGGLILCDKKQFDEVKQELVAKLAGTDV